MSFVLYNNINLNFCVMKLKLFSSASSSFQMNLNVLLFFLFFIGTKTFAQSPELTVKGEEAEKVRIKKEKAKNRAMFEQGTL